MVPSDQHIKDKENNLLFYNLTFEILYYNSLTSTNLQEEICNYICIIYQSHSKANLNFQNLSK